MTTSVMTSTLDGSLLLVTGLLSSLIGIAVYVWTALALAAMFRKMGEDAWKGWVPLLNVATVLRWGGYSPWLVLLALVPIVGPLIVWVLLVVSAHRINPGYGYGNGMTVLAALLFVVWASILGFGPAPWRGARPATLGTAGASSPTRREGSDERSDKAPSSLATPVEIPPVAPSPVPPAPLLSRPGAAPAAPEPAPSSSRAAAPQAWAPPATAPTPPAQASAGPVPSAPPAEPDIAAWPSEVDDVSAVSPSPFPPSSAAASGARHVPPPAPDSGVISFVPGRRTGADDLARVPATARDESPADRPGAPAPVVPVPEPEPAPQAPRPDDAPPTSRAATRARWTGPDPDAFPELSGEVSAVVGSPAAGAPRSALGAVSAQQRREEERASAEDDDVDQTVMVRRKLPTWSLVPVSGAPVALSGDVAILGRRPAGDPAFPGAQLVAVEDLARTVSKTHARIELRGEKWLITDLGSTNGVLIRTLMGDEVEIEPGTELAAGERFFLGDEEFRLQHE